MEKKKHYRNAGRKRVLNGKIVAKTIPSHLVDEFKKYAELWLKSNYYEKGN